MGYNRQEIAESLAQVRYDDVFATYLLLGRKSTDVRESSALWMASVMTFWLSIYHLHANCSLRAMDRDLDHRYHCAIYLAMRLEAMLAVRLCKVPRIVVYTEVYRRPAQSQVVEHRPVRKRYVSPITGLQFEMQ